MILDRRCPTTVVSSVQTFKLLSLQGFGNFRRALNHSRLCATRMTYYETPELFFSVDFSPIGARTYTLAGAT